MPHGIINTRVLVVKETQDKLDYIRGMHLHDLLNKKGDANYDVVVKLRVCVCVKREQYHKGLELERMACRLKWLC